MTFDSGLLRSAERLIDLCRQKHILLATAESCTGGLIAGLLTSIAGSSDVVDCGFVTYSNAAKHHMIGVSESLIAQHGAVSEEVARAMAQGAIDKSQAHIAVAVTGVAGPGGGTPAKPVGLVWLAAVRRDGPLETRELHLGAIGRDPVRLASVREALALVQALVERGP